MRKELQMNNYQPVFEFTEADLQANRQHRLSASQKERLKSVFQQDLTRNGVHAFGLIAMMIGYSTVTFLFVDRSWTFTFLTFVMWCICLGVLWHHLLGKHNLLYLYQRIRDISSDVLLQPMGRVRQSEFELRDLPDIPKEEARFGPIYRGHPYYSGWIRSYAWYYTADFTTFDGWYRHSSDKVELYLAEPQFKALRDDISYTFYCYIDPHRVAYVLSVEPETASD